jgi:hypothetical protein
VKCLAALKERQLSRFFQPEAQRLGDAGCAVVWIFSEQIDWDEDGDAFLAGEIQDREMRFCWIFREFDSNNGHNVSMTLMKMKATDLGNILE